MKKVIICFLCATLIGLIFAAPLPPTGTDKTTCSSLTNCQGAAFCMGGASPNGCNMTCDDGTPVQCDPIMY